MSLARVHSCPVLVPRHWTARLRTDGWPADHGSQRPGAFKPAAGHTSCIRATCSARAHAPFAFQLLSSVVVVYQGGCVPLVRAAAGSAACRL